MIEIAIPGHGETRTRDEGLRVEHLVLDYNGTLARDGELLPGVRERIVTLSGHLTIHVITADTFGVARSMLRELPCELIILPAGDQDAAKLAHIERLGSRTTVCIGNGRNDRLMLREAALGIAVLGGEGIAIETMTAADILAPDILSALDLLLNPLRLTSTLRS
jgi:soluble P-type ATPase